MVPFVVLYKSQYLFGMELLSEIDRIKSVMGLVLEYKKRLTGNEKFLWITQNMGGWIFNEVISNFKKIELIPYYGKYKQYLRLKTKVDTNSLDSVVWSLTENYEDFLNVMGDQDSEKLIDELKKYFPSISEKILGYQKKETNPNEKRGRKKLEKRPKVTSAIVKGRTDLDMSRLKPLSTVQNKPEVKSVDPSPEVKKRGRKPLSGEFTSQEVGRWRHEGIGQLEKIERRIDKYEDQSSKLTNEIIRLQQDLDRRKKFFGIDEEPINESIEKIKLDFKRFIL